MLTRHHPHTLRTVMFTGLLGLGIGLALGGSLPTTSGVHAQDDRVHFSSSAFDSPAVLAASSARNVAVTGYSSMGIGVRGQSNGSANGVEGLSAHGVGGFFAGGAAALHLVSDSTVTGPHHAAPVRGARGSLPQGNRSSSHHVSTTPISRDPGTRGAGPL